MTANANCSKRIHVAPLARPARAVLAVLGICLATSGAGVRTASAADEPIQSRASIREAAAAFALELAAASGPDLPVARAGRLDARLRLAACAAELEPFRPRGGRSLGNVTVGVRCAGPKPWTLYVPVYVSMPGDVVVATRFVARGETLRRDDLRIERRDLATLSRGYLSAPDAAVGKEAKRPLMLGAVVTPRALAAPMLVRRGARVTILASYAGVEIRAAGKAMSDGARGDAVRVRNVTTKRVVEGTVDAAGVVRVAM